MSQTVPNYRWSISEFARAWEAGVFDHRVELIDGEVWPVVSGGWHGKTVGRVIALISHQGVEVTTATLPSGDSLPDPDCWVSDQVLSRPASSARALRSGPLTMCCGWLRSPMRRCWPI